MFPSFEVFCQVMDQYTENYECLVIHNNAKSNKLQDQVFWYKASPHDDFQLGHPEFGNIIMPIMTQIMMIMKKNMILLPLKRKRLCNQC